MEQVLPVIHVLDDAVETRITNFNAALSLTVQSYIFPFVLAGEEAVILLYHNLKLLGARR
jgi:hypothetical protein